MEKVKKTKIKSKKTKPVKKTKSKKKILIKTKKPARRAGWEKLIGKITHYFSNIEVAVINLEFPLKDGDSIRITGGEETDFKQRVKSMQIDYKKVRSAKKGDSVGIKINEHVREGYKVFKI